MRNVHIPEVPDDAHERAQAIHTTRVALDQALALQPEVSRLVQDYNNVLSGRLDELRVLRASRS